MRIAIISDIHGNLEALEATLLVIDQLSVDTIICLGDVVGYGPDPDPCVDLVKERCEVVLLGNHDEAVVVPEIAERFNDYARWAVEWTTDHLSAENREYLKNRPRDWVNDSIRYVHASPKSPERWTYVFHTAEAARQFEAFAERICFIGHTHHPAIFCDNPDAETFSQADRFLINVGSVGQPRDGDPRLCFGLMNTDTWEFQHVRADYSAERTAQKILDAGLPPLLGQRLIHGR